MVNPKEICNDVFDMSSSISSTNDGGYIISGYRGETEESDFYLLKLVLTINMLLNK